MNPEKRKLLKEQFIAELDEKIAGKKKELEMIAERHREVLENLQNVLEELELRREAIVKLK